MNREILFRGKKVGGEWAEGWLIKDGPESSAYYKDYPYRIIWYREDGAHCNAPVITETIGQFTGLTDKNGTKIFEGDALEYSDRTFTQKSGIAMFSVSDGAFFVVADDGEELFINSQMQITGNIHDK